MRRQNTPRRVKRNLLFGCIAERPESPAFVWRMQGMQVRMQMSRLFLVYPYTALKGSVFIPTYFSTFSEILCLYAECDRATSSAIDVSALCVGEGGEKAAQAIVKLFADTPSLLVKDMFFARYLESPSTTDATDHTPAPASSVNPSTSKNNTVMLNGKKYSLDTQGAEFLTDAFHIRLPEAKSILEGVSPDCWPKIVSSLWKSRKDIKGATDKPAYIRDIVSRVTLTGNGKVRAQEPNSPATP